MESWEFHWHPPSIRVAYIVVEPLRKNTEYRDIRLNVISLKYNNLSTGTITITRYPNLKGLWYIDLQAQSQAMMGVAAFKKWFKVDTGERREKYTRWAISVRFQYVAFLPERCAQAINYIYDLRSIVCAKRHLWTIRCRKKSIPHFNTPLSNRNIKYCYHLVTI